jgi:hypothetical protein
MEAKLRARHHALGVATSPVTAVPVSCPASGDCQRGGAPEAACPAPSAFLPEV